MIVAQQTTNSDEPEIFSSTAIFIQIISTCVFDCRIERMFNGLLFSLKYEIIGSLFPMYVLYNISQSLLENEPVVIAHSHN
jgi:hypothetical protein